MEKSDKTVSLVVTLVVSLSLLATAWDLSLVSSLP
ncbi:MFS transporter [Kosakonia sp. BK9b]